MRQWYAIHLLNIVRSGTLPSIDLLQNRLCVKPLIVITLFLAKKIVRFNETMKKVVAQRTRNL